MKLIEDGQEDQNNDGVAYVNSKLTNIEALYQDIESLLETVRKLSSEQEDALLGVAWHLVSYVNGQLDDIAERYRQIDSGLATPHTPLGAPPYLTPLFTSPLCGQEIYNTPQISLGSVPWVFSTFADWQFNTCFQHLIEKVIHQP